MDLFSATKREKLFMKAFLFLLAIVWILPIYSAINNSAKFGGISNYLDVLTDKINGATFPMYFINSILVAAGSCLGICMISTLAGFAFSKINFVGRKYIYSATIICLAVPGTVVIIPFFYILKNIHLYNTLWAVILAEVTLTLPFGILMMKNYFDALPVELIESAYIDGAGLGRIFFSIFFPMSKPALINLGVLSIMWSFQDFLLPTMFLTKSTLFTATMAINTFKGVYGLVGHDMGKYNAALVLIGIPSIILFSLTQKFIVNGLTAGAIKD